jgi:hypothetical protein
MANSRIIIDTNIFIEQRAIIFKLKNQPRIHELYSNKIREFVADFFSF